MSIASGSTATADKDPKGTKPKHPTSDQIVVIGAGPAGLTAALELTRSGKKCVVLESDPEYVGGIARTVVYKGFRMDIGGHRFYTKIAEIEDLWRDILPDDFIEVRRMSRIYYKGRFLKYPLRAWDAFFKMGMIFSVRAVLSHLYRKLRPMKPETTFEDWVTNRFGDLLFKTFFRSYTEKVWGMKCSEISADWAEQRIQGLSLRRVITSAFIPNFGRKGDPAFKTLIDVFDYPRLGCGMMWERCRDLIEADGNHVIHDRKVIGVNLEGNRAISVECVDSKGEKHLYGCTDVISSMALREVIEAFNPEPPAEILAAARKLRYRDFLTVGLRVEQEDCFPDNWIYIHDPDVKLGRIQNFKNWSAEMVPVEGVSFLGLEYFCFEGDDFWKSDDEDLIALGTREIDKIGLAKAEDVTDGVVVRIPKAYPIYDDKYAEAVDTIRKWLGGLENVWSSGRNAMHQYNNQDHSMMTALLSARNIMGTDTSDPWQVNHNAEYLEERAVPRKVEKAAR